MQWKLYSARRRPVAESEALGWAARVAEGLLEAVSFKKATESVRRRRTANAIEGSEFQTVGAAALKSGRHKLCYVDTRNWQQIMLAERRESVGV